MKSAYIFLLLKIFEIHFTYSMIQNILIFRLELLVKGFTLQLSHSVLKYFMEKKLTLIVHI